MNPSPPYQLLLGDCLEQMATLPAGSVDMVCADLPYGTTQNKWDSTISLEPLWAALKQVCKPGAPVVMFCQQPFATVLAASNLKQLRTEWVWNKIKGTGHLNACKYPLKSHELIHVYCDRTPAYHPVMRTGHPSYTVKRSGYGSNNYGMQTTCKTVNTDGTRYPTTVLEFPMPKAERGLHPTQKPIALCEYLIRTYSNPGDVVLDCCMGSGTTGVAALNTGRRFVGIERDPAYYKVACGRIMASPQQLAALRSGMLESECRNR